MQTQQDHQDIANAAFSDAIVAMRLSDNPASPVYAGNYMFMGQVNGIDTFKHIDTRRYLGALSTVGA